MTVRTELSEYFSFASPLVEHLTQSNDPFSDAWAERLSVREQSEQIQALATRMTLACDAVSIIELVPPEATVFDANLRRVISERHAWVSSAVNDLNNGLGISEAVEARNRVTFIELSRVSNEADVLAGEHGITPVELLRYTNEPLGISLDLPLGWVVSADGLSPVLMAPFAQNLSALPGLGPDRWQLGTAIRVRRLRNSEPIDAQQAGERFKSIIERQGPVERVEEVSLEGNPALLHILAPEQADWSATVTVLVLGDFTYFVETGCPATLPGACEAVEGVAGTLVVSG